MQFVASIRLNPKDEPCISKAERVTGKSHAEAKSHKREMLESVSAIFMETILLLIGQTAHGRMAGIIVLTVWPIRGPVVPHENWRENALSALFCNVFYSKVIKIKF